MAHLKILSLSRLLKIFNVCIHACADTHLCVYECACSDSNNIQQSPTHKPNPEYHSESVH